MATPTQRALGVMNNLHPDGQVPPALALRIATAFATGTEATTNNELSLVFIAKLRRYILGVLAAEEAQAAKVAKMEEIQDDADVDLGDDDYSPPEDV